MPKPAQLDRAALVKLRKVALKLPEAHEVEAWGAPTFRVKNKMFAMFAAADTHHGWGRPGVWIKSEMSNQEILIAADPDRYYRPPYMGPSGWVGMWLDKRVSWKVVEGLLRDGWRMVAPKKLAARFQD